MKRLSYSELADLTGKSFRTVKRRLESAGIEPLGVKNRSNQWHSAKALEAIYTPLAAQGEGPDPQQEKALLDKARREHQEMLNKEKAGALLDAEAVERDCFSFARAARDAMLALPDKLSAVLASMSDRDEVHAYLRQEIRDALIMLGEKIEKATPREDKNNGTDNI